MWARICISHLEKVKNQIVIFSRVVEILLTYGKSTKIIDCFVLKGLLIYFAYGIRHSMERCPKEEEEDDDSCSERSETLEKKHMGDTSGLEHASESAQFIPHEKTSEC